MDNKKQEKDLKSIAKEAKLPEGIDGLINFFNDDLDAIEEELEKSKYYSGIIDEEIKALSANGQNVLGATKGSQHYLIEHIANAVELQTQRQGLRRDRFNIKKTIIDLASKNSNKDDGTENNQRLIKLMEDVLNKDRSNQTSQTTISEEENNKYDSEIDNILNENN